MVFLLLFSVNNDERMYFCGYLVRGIREGNDFRSSFKTQQFLDALEFEDLFFFFLSEVLLVKMKPLGLMIIQKSELGVKLLLVI